MNSTVARSVQPNPNPTDARIIDELRKRLSIAEERADKAEEAIERLRSQLERLPLASMLITPNLEILRWSPMAEKLFGWAENEAVGQTLSTLCLLGSVEIQAVQACIEGLSQGENAGTLSVESAFTCKRQPLSCEWYLTPVRIDDGTLSSVLVLVRDITDIAQMHASLSEAHLHYRRLFEETQQALSEIQILYRTGVELNHARTTQALLQAVVEGAQFITQADRVVGVVQNPSTKHDHLFLAREKGRSDEVRDQEEQALLKMLDVETRGSKESMSAELLRIQLPIFYREQKLGALIVSRHNGGRPFTNRDIELIRTLGNQAAITAINLFYTVRMKEQADLLKQSNAELEQFAYIASHDLQEPLRMITNFSRLLSNRVGPDLPPEGLEYLTFIVDGSERMNRLIEDLLTYSRVGTRAQRLAPVHSEQPLLEALLDLQPIITSEKASVTHDPLPIVQADATQLSQLFQNLIANACKFRGETPPRIHVSAQADGSAWLFRVTDNGIGIESRFHSRIFDTFARLHTHEEYPGTGIGLAVCKKIVERHGGTIWVESEPNKGSTFCFRLRDESSPGSIRVTGRI